MSFEGERSHQYRILRALKNRFGAVDEIGVFAMAGAGLRARFIGHRSGHALNNQVLRALFADDANWRLLPDETGAGTTRLPVWHDNRMAASAV